MTLRTSAGETAADIAYRMGRQQVYDFLTLKEEEVAARQVAEALAAVRLAERTRAADIAAKALMEELAAEEEAEKAMKQAKKGKKPKAKGKRMQATAGGKSGNGNGGGGAAAAAAPSAVAAAAAEARPSMASLTVATVRLSIGENKEETAQEKKRGGNSHVEANPPASAAKPSSFPSAATNDDDEEEEEAEDDEEAFRTFLLEDAPLSYHCPIGICLLTDPINAADGHTYQRAELERWIETCRVKQQPLTSPMTKEPMASMFFPARLIKSQVGEYIDQRRQEWVARRGKKKGGK